MRAGLFREREEDQEKRAQTKKRGSRIVYFKDSVARSLNKGEGGKGGDGPPKYKIKGRKCRSKVGVAEGEDLEVTC